MRWTRAARPYAWAYVCRTCEGRRLLKGSGNFRTAICLRGLLASRELSPRSLARYFAHRRAVLHAYDQRRHQFLRLKAEMQPQFSSSSRSSSSTTATCQARAANVPFGVRDARREAIEHAVIQVFGVAGDELRRASRGRANVALARQVAMYLAHVGCGLSLTEAGRLFERDRTTVAHACGVIEDRREDPLFDRALDLLEWAVPLLAVRDYPETPAAS